jgi:ketosteroid isomerase-like protein
MATQILPRVTLERMHDAINQHDLDAFVDCFDPAYQSEQPAHPNRGFTGNEQVRKNWSSIFSGIPDLKSELLRSSITGDTVWAEWHWFGTRTDGTKLDMRGVTIMVVHNGRITSGHLYMEPVEQGGSEINTAVRDMTGKPPKK